jgi:hypothetical protein
MNCEKLEKLVERSGGGPLPRRALAHLEECAVCRDFVADLECIAAEAKTLRVEAEPPEYVWTALRSQLVAEGIIRESVQAPGWLLRLRTLLAGPSLAAAAVGVLVLGGALALWKTAPKAPGSQQAQPGAPPVLTAARNTLQAEERGVTEGFTLTDSRADHSLRQNLAIVDDFIAQCEQRVQQEPYDELAQEYLSSAYQQKAELLSAMLDRSGGGE